MGFEISEEGVEKLIYVLWKPEEDADADFAQRMLGDVAKQFADRGVHGLSMNLVDEHAAAVQKSRITHLNAPIAGTLSCWLDSADDRGPYEEILRGVTARTAGYLVVESVPIVNTTHTAPLGQRTPLINMVALIERPDWISWDEWVHHWHGHHRKVALETQSTFLYIRNVVVRALTPEAPPWSGIVEEGFNAEAVTDPMQWYDAGGSPEKLKENMERMIESVKAFLDMSRVESHPTSEYRLVE